MPKPVTPVDPKVEPQPTNLLTAKRLLSQNEGAAHHSAHH